ncbi:MAG TPA: hypothetical protein VMR54_12115 [Thermoanaerobaculia bacterium]|nr:hypothetical protein [Thermoanaerobaculia bacterium]
MRRTGVLILSVQLLAGSAGALHLLAPPPAPMSCCVKLGIRCECRTSVLAFARCSGEITAVPTAGPLTLPPDRVALVEPRLLDATWPDILPASQRLADPPPTPPPHVPASDRNS